MLPRVNYYIKLFLNFCFTSAQYATVQYDCAYESVYNVFDPKLIKLN